jgi:hypothetical protein
VVFTLNSPEKVKVNYEPRMGRTIINCKKWDLRVQKAPTRFTYCNCCTMIVYLCFYEGKDVKLDVSCFGVGCVGGSVQSAGQQEINGNTSERGKIRLIDGHAKCRHLKKLT